MSIPNPPRTLAILGVSVAVIVTVTLGALASRLRLDVATSEVWVRHSLDVERQFDRVLLAMTDAETGQRGYLLVHDSAYLTPYQTAITALNAQIDSLVRLTADSVSQQRRVERLEMIVNAKLAELRETVDLAARGDPDGALRIVTSNRGRDLMEVVRQTVREGIADEERLLADRTAALDETIRNRTYLVWALIALNAVMLVGLLFVTRRLQQLEPMAIVCAWSKTIEYENEWITFETYLARRFNVRVTHGISPAQEELLKLQLEEMRAGNKGT